MTASLPLQGAVDSPATSSWGVLEEVSEWAAGEARELGRRYRLRFQPRNIHMDGQILRRVAGNPYESGWNGDEVWNEDAERLALGKSEGLAGCGFLPAVGNPASC